MTQLIECIPNFSEARRPEVIDQIVAAIKSVTVQVCLTVPPTLTTTARC